MTGIRIGAEQPKPQRGVLAAGLIAVVIAINVVATQYLAAHFAYPPALGARLLAISMLPWEWLFWQQKFALPPRTSSAQSRPASLCRWF